MLSMQKSIRRRIHEAQKCDLKYVSVGGRVDSGDPSPPEAEEERVDDMRAIP